jgi:hypothetical protein
MKNKEIIWQPLFVFPPKYDFSVHLNNNFARQMIEAKIPNEMQRRMNEIASEGLKGFNISHLEPYVFYRDSCFVQQINIGMNGTWLAAGMNIENFLREKKDLDAIEYSSHNVDNLHQAFALNTLFDKWIQYSDVLRDIK